MASYALDSVRTEIQSYLHFYSGKHGYSLSWIWIRWNSLNPMEQLLLGAPTIHDVDDPLCTFIVALLLTSKDFTVGVVIVEVGLKKLCT